MSQSAADFGSSPLAPGSLHLRLTSDPAHLAPVRKAVEHYALACGFDATGAAEVGLCVNEALANITRHAYEGKTDQPVLLEVVRADDRLEVSIRDWGIGRTPPSVPDHDPAKPGGLGLICLRTLMDEVTYHPQPDGMQLRMTRKAPQR